MLIDTGPRVGTADTASLNALVASANTIFDAIAAGTHDADLDQVFGHTNLATAKTKYAKRQDADEHLHAAIHIVTGEAYFYTAG
jgi:hypothetical protein